MRLILRLISMLFFLSLLQACALYGDQASALYGNKVRVDLSHFVASEYSKKETHELTPDYYYKGADELAGATMLFIYKAHPGAGFYTDAFLKGLQEKYGKRASMVVIRDKSYVKIEYAYQTGVETDFITGFKDGFLLISFKGIEQDKLHQIVETIQIK